MTRQEDELQLNQPQNAEDGGELLPDTAVEAGVKQDGCASGGEACNAENGGADSGCGGTDGGSVVDAVKEDVGGEEDSAQAAVGGEVATPTVGKPPRKGKSKVIWNIILLLLIGLGIGSLFGIVSEIGPDAGSSFGEVFGNASVWFMLLLVAVVLGIMTLDCAKFCIIDKTVTGRVRFSSSVKTSFLGKYYDAVTPFSTGGQPMQIYYLNSKGISGGNATAIVMIRYFSSILTWITLGSALMIYGTVNHILDGVSGKTLLLIAGWIGVGVNLIIPVFIVFFLAFPKFMYKFTGGLVRLGKKMKLVKDEEKTLGKAIKVVDDFKNSFRVMATSPLKLILLILVSFGEAFLTFSVPYFVMKAFSCDVSGQLITIMSLNAFATFGVSFIPTPGNSGVMEGMAALAFSAAAGPTLAWSVLVWRLAVYYIYILVGLIISVRDIIKKNLIKRRSGKEPRKQQNDGGT